MARIARYVLYMLPGFGAGALAYLLALRPRRRRLAAGGLASGPAREGAVLLFWAYCGGMAALTLVPQPGYVSAALMGYTAPYFDWSGLSRRASLIPFSQPDSLFNILGNIVMFLPFGLFAALLWRGFCWGGPSRSFSPSPAPVSSHLPIKRYSFMAQPILQTENLVFRYTTGEGVAPTVLDGLTLSIRPGEFVAVLGHNGSGKSTLAKHFNAILLPSGGKVYVDGMDTCDEAQLLDIRRQVGMVFQNPDNQIVASVVEEDVAFGPENLGIPSAEIRERVDAALAAVGMADYARHAPHLLSGGQKQRVAIAGVLAMRPRCIVLDEPTAMLDPVGRKEVLDTIRRLNREQNITVVLITHHMDEAAQAERLIVMHDGHIVADDKPELVFQNVDGLRSLGLEVPEPVALLYELRQAGVDVPLTALTVDQCAAVLKELLA